jgi:hypothetical protein
MVIPEELNDPPLFAVEHTLDAVDTAEQQLV